MAAQSSGAVNEDRNRLGVEWLSREEDAFASTEVWIAHAGAMKQRSQRREILRDIESRSMSRQFPSTSGVFTKPEGYG